MNVELDHAMSISFSPDSRLVDFTFSPQQSLLLCTFLLSILILIACSDA